MTEKARIPTMFTITELALTTANTGYSWTPAGSTCGFSVQCRDATDVKMGASQESVQTGGSSFVTIKASTALNSPQDFASNGTTAFWFSAASNSKVLEIIEWKNR